MEPLYVHLAIWLFPVSKPNIQIQIETPFGKRQFHGSFSKYCELWPIRPGRRRGDFGLGALPFESTRPTGDCPIWLLYWTNAFSS